MIKLELGNKKYNIPSDWDELTLGDWQKISDIDVSYEEEVYRSYYLVINILSIFNVLGDLTSLSILQITQIGNEMKYLTQNPISELKNIIKIDEKEYGLELNMFGMSAGAYFDAEKIVKNSKNIDKLHILMATFYRPIKKKRKKDYDLEPYDTSTLNERAQEFKKVSALEAAAFINFITAHGIACIESFQSFTTQKLEQMKQESAHLVSKK